MFNITTRKVITTGLALVATAVTLGVTATPAEAAHRCQYDAEGRNVVILGKAGAPATVTIKKSGRVLHYTMPSEGDPAVLKLRYKKSRTTADLVVRVDGKRCETT